MKDDLLKILSNSNKEDINHQQLMDYLEGKLSAGESHEVEKMMADNELLNDAMEGLQGMRERDIQTYVEQLNRGLQKSLTKKRQRREKRKLKEGPWGYVAIIVIIMLCIAAYYVVKKALLSH
jgi:anti-sigma factor RsiW